MPSAPLRETTLGIALQSTESDGFSVADVSYPAGATFGNHAHDRTYLSFVLRGGFAEEVGHGSSTLKSGSVVVMPARTRHVNRIGPAGARSLIVTLDPELEQRLSLEHRVTLQWRSIHRGSPTFVLARAYRAYREDGARELLTIEELLHAFFDGVRDTPDESRSARGVVARAIEIVRATYTAPPPLARIAALCGCDPAYLCRAFRRQLQCTIGEYARQLRMKSAMERIASSDLPLADIAAHCGFADQSHLTRTFTAFYGMPPRAYRQFARA
jgi:AraC-like DNA-binding protein/quercetin dioxygenase-like cupin family protein